MNISAHSAPLSSVTTTQVKAKPETKTANEQQLSQADLEQIKQLKARDQVVRTHEAAHLAAGQGVAQGPASYTYQHGPDGSQYAIGGEVKIDTSEVSGDPEATLTKAQQIQASALAPAQPSSQDRAVAAKAAKMAIEAQAEINQQRQEQQGKLSPTVAFESTSTEINKLIDLTA